MKTSNSKIGLLVLAAVILTTGIFVSCSKKSSGPSGPKAPSIPGGYDSSAQIQPGALVAFWPFNNSLNDTKGMTATNAGVTFASGMNGKMAYQGGTTPTYALYTTSSAVKAMTSFTVSFWINAQQPITPQAILQLSNATQYWPELDIDLENYNPTPASDSLKIKMYMENNANNVWTVAPQAFLDTAVGKWTQVVITYNGTAGSVTMYQNGTSIAFGYPYSPAGGTVGPVPFYVSDPGSLTNTNGATLWGNADFSQSASLVIGAWQGKTNPALNPGQGSDTWNTSYAGLLQNLRIYNTALNSSDVKSLYILESGGF